MEYPEAEGWARQPPLCKLDLEGWCDPWQPTAGPNQPRSLAAPRFAPNGGVNALDRAQQVVHDLLRWFNLQSADCGSNSGLVAGTGQVNLTNGNLVVSLRTPAGDVSDPPVFFYYNSFSQQENGYGYGWTGLYRQEIQEVQGGFPLLLMELRGAADSNENPLRWQIVREGGCGRVQQIVDPFSRPDGLLLRGRRIFLRLPTARGG